MRIAMVTGSAGDNHCGVGDYACELAQHLALDADVSLYYDRGHGPVHPPFEKLDTLVMRPVSYGLLGFNSVMRELREEGFDIVHVQYPSKGYGMNPTPGFIPQQLAGMQSRSRIVVTLHEWSTSHPLRQMVSDQMISKTDALVVTNEAEMEKLQPRMGARPTAMMSVGNVLTSRQELENIWAEAEGRPPLAVRPLLGPQGREPLSLFHYGLPASGKGFMRMLEALKLLRAGGVFALLFLYGDFPAAAPLTQELLNKITELEISDAVIRRPHLPRESILDEAERYKLGFFPFDEGYSSKRSSVANLTAADLPILVGGGAKEEHPFLFPRENTAQALADRIRVLFAGELEADWGYQVQKQRDYGKRFSFQKIASGHIQLYEKLRKLDV